VLDEPEISDAAYDRMMNPVEGVGGSASGTGDAGFSTVRVGERRARDFPRCGHARPMLSLDNAFSYDALREWDRRVREGSGQEKIRSTSRSQSLMD